MISTDLVAFENRIKSLWESGDLPSLIHLCGGNEEALILTFNQIRNTSGQNWIFSTHRTHYHALLAGHDPDALEQKIKDGRSMFVYSREHNFFCSAVLAGACGIAAGVALAMKNADEQGWVWCFIGDGGEENGHFYEAAMFVEGHALPCTFIIEDNDRSVDTPVLERRGIAPGLENLFKCVLRYRYTPIYPHAGSGCSFQIQFKPEAIERIKKESPVPEPKSFMETMEPYPNTDAFRQSTGR